MVASLAIDPEKKLVALTFDDGPSTKHTNLILDVLEQYNARATFFVIGNRIEKNADVVARAISLNCEIGSHTWGHSNFRDYEASVLVSSLKKVDEEMQSRFGYHIRLFRPTYGAINENVTAGAVRMEYPMVLWSGSTHDWSNKNADKIYQYCFECAADGAVILFHDIYDPTAEAIARIVPDLVDQGYQLVTVSELIYLSGETVQPGSRFSGWAEIVDPSD